MKKIPADARFNLVFINVFAEDRPDHESVFHHCPTVAEAQRVPVVAWNLQDNGSAAPIVPIGCDYRVSLNVVSYIELPDGTLHDIHEADWGPDDDTFDSVDEAKSAVLHAAQIAWGKREVPYDKRP